LGPIGSAVLTFIGYKQTDKQTDKPNLYIDYTMPNFDPLIKILQKQTFTEYSFKLLDLTRFGGKCLM